MDKIFLSIGSNVGQRKTNLSKAVLLIESISRTSITAESSIYETEPMYNTKQAYFLNKVIEIQTKLNPRELLENVKSIECGMGRSIKGSHNAPRIIDIDILVFKDRRIDSKDLILPHPRISERRFVLEPWMEIDPGYIMIDSELSVKELYMNYLKTIDEPQKSTLIEE